MTPQSQLLVPPVTVGANFKDFARSRARVPESGSSARSRNNELRESAVVDSDDAPAAQPWLSPVSRNAVVVSSGGTSTAGGGGCMSLSNDAETCDVTLTSFSGGSGATATDDLVNQPTAGDKKRKGKEITNEAISRYQNEDMKIDYSDSRKESGGPAAKRSRAAEVRNLSVRRRRNRINEKMRALQELIPRCNKTDKASMLDEAIEYFKSLQMQVQMMMSMGCGMLPVMFLGAQQYMPPMEIGINQPTTPFSAVLPGSGLPTAGEPSLYDPKFHLTNSSTPNVPAPDPSRILQTMDELNSSRTPPASTDPYLQYQSDLQMPLHIPQDQPNYIRGTDMK